MALECDQCTILFNLMAINITIMLMIMIIKLNLVYTLPECVPSLQRAATYANACLYPRAHVIHKNKHS